MINVLSYGGGVNSSALFFWLINNKYPLDILIFSDTGEETPETYDAVKRMAQECEKVNIPFVTVKSPLGNLYDYYFNKKAVPSVMRRDCTGKFKIRPIRRYLRETYGKKETFLMYIGIAFEEWTRVKESNVKYIVNSFPFVDLEITREGNNRILKNEGFKAQKSGCKGCIYLKRKDWFNMAINDPQEFKRWLALDENNKAYPRVTHSPNFPLKVIAKAAKGQTTLPMVETPNYNCDTAGGCFL